MEAVKKYICKHCKTTVMSPKDTRAKLGYEHSRSCPRRNKM